MSLVPAKSLLPFLAQLNEEQRSVADAGGSMSLRKAREAEEEDDDGPEREGALPLPVAEIERRP